MDELRRCPCGDIIFNDWAVECYECIGPVGSFEEMVQAWIDEADENMWHLDNIRREFNHCTAQLERLKAALKAMEEAGISEGE